MEGEFDVDTGALPPEEDFPLDVNESDYPEDLVAVDPEIGDFLGKVLVAQWDFEAQNEDELSVLAGDRLIVVQKVEDWWLVETEDGTRQGYLPASFCDFEDNIDFTNQGDGQNDDIPEVTGDTDEPRALEFDVDEGPLPAEDASETFETDQINTIQDQTKPPNAGTNPVRPDFANIAWRVHALKAAKEGNADQTAPDLPGADELKQRFEELKKEVDDIKLLSSEAMQVKQKAAMPPPPAPPPVQVTSEQPSSPAPPPPAPPPPSAAQAHKKLLEQKLAKEKEIAELSHLKQLELKRKELEKEVKRLEEEKVKRQSLQQDDSEIVRIKLLEEESRRRAAMERTARQNAERVQQSKIENERKELERLGLNGHRTEARRTAPSASNSSALLNEGVAVVKQAVKYDNAKLYAEAYSTYSQALDLFTKALDSGKVSAKTGRKVIDRMDGYLKRMYKIESVACTTNSAKRNDNFVNIITTMTKNGFNPTTEGEESYLQARLAEGKNDRTALGLYNKGLEYLMAYHNACKAKGKATEPRIVEMIGNMLDRAEALKRLGV